MEIKRDFYLNKLKKDNGLITRIKSGDDGIRCH